MRSPLIKSITPRGLLSFGPDTPPLELGMLNVLIGPNASGKSNLLDVLGLVRRIPSDMQEAVQSSGGTRSWLWESDTAQQPVLELVVNLGSLIVSLGNLELQHRMMLRSIESELLPVSEQIHYLPNTLLYESQLDTHQAKIWVRRRDQEPLDSRSQPPPYRPRPGSRRVRLGPIEPRDGELIEFSYPDQENQSILAQLRSLFDYPQMTILASVYNAIQIYSTWHFGRDALLRRSQPADQRGDRLEEDYTNLGMVLNQIGTSPEAKQSVIEGLRELYDGFTNYEAIVNSGSVQIYFTEGKQRSIPATRLSDGTLRYLCLLAILYNPNSRPVVCIEEPELGLHPDIIPRLVKHLRAASERIQVIITTHSDILIDALSDTPESIIVFEKHDGPTQMGRLKPEDLSVWLEEYRLGELWMSGEIGGTRW